MEMKFRAYESFFLPAARRSSSRKSLAREKSENRTEKCVWGGRSLPKYPRVGVERAGTGPRFESSSVIAVSLTVTQLLLVFDADALAHHFDILLVDIGQIHALSVGGGVGRFPHGQRLRDIDRVIQFLEDCRVLLAVVSFGAVITCPHRKRLVKEVLGCHGLLCVLGLLLATKRLALFTRHGL